MYFTCQYILLIISHSVLLRIRNVSHESCRKNRNTHFMFSIFFKSRLCDIIWKVMVESDRPKMTTGRTCITCWITKAKNTHSNYVILIALPQHQRVLERVNITFYLQCLCCLLPTRIIVSGSFIYRHTAISINFPNIS